MEPNEDDLAMLRHMLGLTDRSKRVPTSHRNYAAVNPCDERFVRLVSMGLVEKYRDPETGMRYELYRCTDEGIGFATESAMALRYPKKRRTYIRWLELSDCDAVSTSGLILTGCIWRSHERRRMESARH